MRFVVANGSKNTNNDFKHVLNCSRLITRILPLIAEDQSDDFLDLVFWQNVLPSPPQTKPETVTTPTPQADATGPADGDETEAKALEQPVAEAATNGIRPAAEGEAEEEKKKEEETQTEAEASAAVGGEESVLFQGEDSSDPLAIRLLNAVVNLLFYPNFTVPPLKKMPARVDIFPLEQVW
jgi:hypothetical protein